MTPVPTAAEVLAQYQDEAARAAAFLAVLLIGYALGRIVVVSPLVRLVRARNRNNPTLVDATGRYAKLVVAVVAFYLGTAAAGFTGFLSGSAIVLAAATVAIGIAGQDVIGNVVSGAFLVADRDFNVGDYIEWNGQAGTVEAIDFRVTRVRTLANETVTVPNTQLATSAIHNPYARRRYRVTERLGVPYDADLERVSDLLVAAASEDDRVAADRAPVVHATGFGSSGVDLAARFWIRNPRDVDVEDVRTGFIDRATERLDAAGVTVNPPSQHELSGDVDVVLAGERTADDEAVAEGADEGRGGGRRGEGG